MDGSEAENILLRVESVLDKHLDIPLSRSLRRELLTTLAQMNGVGYTSARAALLQQRLSFSYIPGITNNAEVSAPPSASAAPLPTSEHRPNTPVHNLPPVLLTMPSQVDRTFLLRPVPPGQRLQCLLVRQRSALTRSSPTFLFSLVRVAPAAPAAAPSWNATTGSGGGGGGGGGVHGDGSSCGQPLFLFGAKRASSSSSSAPTLSSFPLGSSNATAAAAPVGTAYCVFATEKNASDGIRSGLWQEKSCFGWVRGLGDARCTTTATVNDPASAEWSALSSNPPSSSSLLSQRPVSRLENMGDSIAIQVSTSEGPDRLLKLSAVLPARMRTRQPQEDDSDGLLGLRASKHPTLGTAGGAGAACLSDEGLACLFRDATAAAAAASLPQPWPSSPSPPPSVAVSIPTANGANSSNQRSLLNISSTAGTGTTATPGAVRTLPPVQPPRKPQPMPTNSVPNSHSSSPLPPTPLSSSPSSSSSCALHLMLRSKMPQWGLGAVCGLDTTTTTSSNSSSSSNQQQQQQQVYHPHQQVPQQRSGPSLNFEWSESLMEASRKNVALVCAHHDYRTHPPLQQQNMQHPLSTLSTRDDAAAALSPIAATVTAVGKRRSSLPAMPQRPTPLSSLPPPSSPTSPSSVSSPPVAAATATGTVAAVREKHHGSGSKAESADYASSSLVFGGERGAPPGLWKGGVELSEAEDDRGTLESLFSYSSNSHREERGDGGAATVLQVLKIDTKKAGQQERARSSSSHSVTSSSSSLSLLPSSGPFSFAASNASASGGAAAAAASSGHDHFRVDIASPLSPFQAFALVLAVFEGQ